MMSTGTPRTSRREWLLDSAAIASSVAATLAKPARAASGPVPPTAPSGHEALVPAAPRYEPPVAEAADAASLIAPFAEGSQLGPWKIERFLPFRYGAAILLLSDEDGVSFQLDICARDTAKGAPTPPASSEWFDVFLANGGEGRLPSCEQHGLAAMAVAEVIRHNEARLTHSGFLTLRERLRRTD